MSRVLTCCACEKNFPAHTLACVATCNDPHDKSDDPRRVSLFYCPVCHAGDHDCREREG